MTPPQGGTDTGQAFGQFCNDTVDVDEDSDLVYGGNGNQPLCSGRNDDIVDPNAHRGCADNPLNGDAAVCVITGNGFYNGTMSGGEGGHDRNTITADGITANLTGKFVGDAVAVFTHDTNKISFAESERTLTGSGLKVLAVNAD